MPASDQGKLSGRYSLIPRTLIFLTRAGQVLLIKGAANKRLWANRYNGLGGHVERGEGVLAAARRELSEESGLHAPDLHLCGVITIDAGPETGIGIYVLRGECPTGESRPSLEGALEWIDPARLADLPTVEDLPALLGRALVQSPGEAPFSAHYWYNEAGQLHIVFDA